MSKKSSATSALRGAARQAAGAHLTKEARMGTAARVVAVLYKLGFQIQGVESLGARHLHAYFAKRKADGISVRTMQNEAAHIRGVHVAAGRNESPRLS